MSGSSSALDRHVYEDLRTRLIDRTRRNRLLHFQHGARSSIVRIVDEAPGWVIEQLQDDKRLRFKPLPDPDADPEDERTPPFRAALAAARNTDQEYRKGLAEIDPEDPAAAAKEASLDRELRDRVRAQLGLPPRPQRRTINVQDYARAHGVEPAFELALPRKPLPAKHADESLQTLLFPDQLRSRLSTIAKSAQAIEQETGVSTLHLAFAFLEWFESETSDTAFHSPLLLLPVGLERRKVRGEEDFRLFALDDDPSTNLSLELRLREELRITLPTFDPDAKDAIESYVSAVAETVRPLKRWRVRRFVTLAHFSFARIAMYRDLDPANWQEFGSPAAYPLVQPVVRGAAGSDGSGLSFADEHEIDKPEIERLAPILVHDADSSQHSAIIDAMQGRSLVIEGPPGTGKSQTIANLIANAIHAGKTVLFVSEKMAALDVVKSRLDRAELGHFCLALHAAGAKPSAVIETLRTREAMRPPPAQPRPGDNVQAARARAEIRAHLDVLHASKGPFDETVHALIGRMADLGRVLPHLPVRLRPRAGDLPAEIDASAVLVARERLEALEAAAGPAERPEWRPLSSPFRVLERADLFSDEQAALLELLRTLADQCAALRRAANDLAAAIGGETIQTPAAVRASAAAIETLNDPPENADRAVLARIATPAAVEDALWCAGAAQDAEQARERLSAAGLSDPAKTHTERLQVVTRLARLLGLPNAVVGELPGQVQQAAADLARIDDFTKTVALLSATLGLESDPDAGAIRLMCAAVELVAAVDAAWLGHRKAGLEHHAPVLESAAQRQQAIEKRHREIAERLSLSEGTATSFLAAAAALQRRGLFAVLRSEFREAKRFFRARWRAHRLPRWVERVRHLETAAAVFADQDDLRSDKALRAAVGDVSDPLSLPLARLAQAAAWQARVRAQLTGERLEVGKLRILLVALDPERLQQLKTAEASAQALRAFLDRGDVQDQRKWSQIREAVAVRTEGLEKIADVVRDIGLAPGVRLIEAGMLAECQERLARANKDLSSPRAHGILGDARPDAEAIRSCAEFARRVHDSLPRIASALLADGWSDAVSRVRTAAAAARQAAAEHMETLGRLAPLGLESLARSAQQQPIETVRNQAEKLVAASQELTTYLEFARAHADCRTNPIAWPVASALADAEPPLRHLSEGLAWLVAWTTVRRCAEQNREVFSRTGMQLSALRQSFAAADRARLKADARAVATVALRRRPPEGSSAGSKKDWTDDALLQNEFGKQRRHIRVRDLLGRAGNAVLTLTPCLMMSPLTVAQYLRPGRVSFDLVIMDEASQIKPEDAIGALLRGRQTVIVGDPKQLPPTNFFDRALDDGDDDEDSENRMEALSPHDRVVAESILDLSARAFRPARRLRWHYRSQHESLIAFSNRQFYGNNLIVFPASHAPSETLGIELVQMQGHWRERVNVEEAQAVAQAVARFMGAHPTLSCGVVAMNQPQRELIESELEQLIARNPDAAAYRDLWEGQLEPLFVKNLENVQGDERDVIFISLGWGKNPEGAVFQRFFPVNRREDGHRRLNVLFTRAKRKIVLFSSIRPEDIVVDAEKTAPGVRVLRDYLLYARDGRLDHGAVSGEPTESPFEASVASALRERGHSVFTQVGVAGYRVDIGIAHPEMQSRFVLGIECDGAAYHSARSARDRDRLRQEALERLGWRLARVWSTDWFRDPHGQAERLSAEIAQAIRAVEVAASGRLRLVDAPMGDGATGPAAPAADGATAPAAPPTDAAPSPAPARPVALPLHLPGELPLAPPVDGHAALRAVRDVADALRQFREAVIMRDFPGSEPNRCILREQMIQAMVRTQLDDPADFLGKIPESLRTRTDGRQTRYLERICEIVSRSAGSGMSAAIAGEGA